MKASARSMLLLAQYCDRKYCAGSEKAIRVNLNRLIPSILTTNLVQTTFFLKKQT